MYIFVMLWRNFLRRIHIEWCRPSEPSDKFSIRTDNKINTLLCPCHEYIYEMKVAGFWFAKNIVRNQRLPSNLMKLIGLNAIVSLYINLVGVLAEKKIYTNVSLLMNKFDCTYRFWNARIERHILWLWFTIDQHKCREIHFTDSYVSIQIFCISKYLWRKT